MFFCCTRESRIALHDGLLLAAGHLRSFAGHGTGLPDALGSEEGGLGRDSKKGDLSLGASSVKLPWMTIASYGQGKLLVLIMEGKFAIVLL